MKIWIDLDNTPHIPLFIPIKRELERRGYEVVLTARDAFQVCELADHFGLKCHKVGRHYGKNMLMKVFGLVWRSLQLLPFVLKERPDLALSHGARSQIFLSNRLGILTILISDYEYTVAPPLCRPRWEIVPDVIASKGLHSAEARVLKYPGIKEDVYVSNFCPNPSLLRMLGLSEQDFIVTVRPPANEAHYHNPEAEVLFEKLMNHLCETPEIRVVLLPRNKAQELDIRRLEPTWFENNKTIVPDHAVNGLDLLWYSDLVVSGGGTMNREAAALRVPVYSIFRGATGAVDRWLEAEGRLVMIKNVEELHTKIKLCRRDKRWEPGTRGGGALAGIIGDIEDILRVEGQLAT